MSREMDSEDDNFRLRIAISIRIFVASSRFFESQKRIESILTRLEAYPFEPTENETIQAKVATIRRYLDASEVGSAKHELLSLSAMLTEKHT